MEDNQDKLNTMKDMAIILHRQYERATATMHKSIEQAERAKKKVEEIEDQIDQLEAEITLMEEQ